MTEQAPGEFTVSDLIRGWDDVRLLLARPCPDETWAVVSSWSPRRLAAAVVAAVTVLPPDYSVAADRRLPCADVAANGRWSMVSDRGHVAGHVTVPERPR